MTAKTRADLETAIDTDLADNTTGQISAQDVRENMKDSNDSAVFPEDAGHLLGASTGWLSGGLVTKNATAGQFDYASGTGVIVDASDPTAITATAVSWTGATGIAPTNILTQGATFLAIDVSGNLVQSSSFPVGGNLRTLIQIGGMTHGDNVNIEAVTDFTSTTPFQNAPDMTDFMIAIGVINTSGNVFSGSVNANLLLDKSVGTAFYLGISSKATPLTPNTKTTPALAEPNILFSWRDGAGGFNTTVRNDVQAGVYDNNGGGASNPTDSLGGTKWTNLRIHYSPDLEETIIQWGTTLYNNSSDAVAGIASDFFGDNPSFAGVPVRGYLSIVGSATDLTDVADGIFTEANKFGSLF